MNEEVKKIRSVYFIGIGGIGMSALARFFHARGIKVSGYDRSESELTSELQQEGIPVHFKEDVENIPKDVDAVIFTPAVPADQKELVFYRQQGYNVMKRSDALQIVTQGLFTICVAGTHGKTTTTTMIAHLLRDSGYGCSAFLGGISVNYGTNFWSAEPDPGHPEVCVVEADEYDRSFLKLNPDIAVITAMDPDHLDIYGTVEAMEQAFIDFSDRLKPGGLLVNKFGLKRAKELFKGVDEMQGRKWTYSLQNPAANAFAENIRMANGSYEFDVTINDRRLENIVLNMGGMHNVENTVAAITVASSLDIGDEKIKAAVENFQGVKRRFEYIIKNNSIVFIDDYAHHPEELRALIHGAKSLFRGKKCTLIFQPHLYTRTRDLATEFAASLDEADEIILLPIYPARELPLEGISSEMILEKMKNRNKRCLGKQELLEWVEKNYSKNIDHEFGSVLITAGAGDIDGLVEPIKEILEKK